MNAKILKTCIDVYKRQVEESGSTREVIIAGDFNGRTGKQMDSQIIRRFEDDAMNDNENRLVDILKQYSLRNLNAFYQHKEIHVYMTSGYITVEVNYRQHNSLTANKIKSTGCLIIQMSNAR